MIQVFKVLLVCAMAHYLAYFLLARLTIYKSEIKLYLKVTILVLAVPLITGNILLGYLTTAFTSVLVTKSMSPSNKIAYFFGIVFSMSYFGGVHLNPGVDLGSLTHPRVLIITVLLPLVIFTPPDRDVRRFNLIDAITLGFFAWIILINLRIPSITGMLRQDLWLIIDFLIPYFAIRRYSNNYGLLLAALAFSLFSQSAIGVAEAVLKWHLHTEVEGIAGFADPVSGAYKYRGSFLRAHASYMNALIFALFANFAFACSIIYLRKIGISIPNTYSKLAAWGAVGITALGTASTGSRAGISGSVIIVLLSFILLWAIQRRRNPKKALVVVVIAFGVGLLTVGQEFLLKEFPYRMRLLDVGGEVIMSNPLVGNQYFIEDPRMQVLHLGEGIIDIVNTYLDIALNYGLPAMILFIIAILCCLSRLYDSLRFVSDEKLAFGIFSFTSLVIMAFNLATASPWGWNYPWIWISVAIGANIVARVNSDRIKNAMQHQNHS